MWQVLGTAAYSIAQWLLVLTAARLAGPETVGQLALAMAITIPIFAGLGLNLQVVAASDAELQWTLVEYSRLRRTMNLISIGVTALVGLLINMPRSEYAVLIAVALCRAVDARLFLMYGYYQRRARQDLLAASQITRSILGLAAFAGLLAWSNVLWVACLGLFASWSVVAAMWDSPRTRRMADLESASVVLAHDDAQSSTANSLFRTAWPLGVNALCRSLTLSMPRYAVAVYVSVFQLGVFAGLSSLSLALTVATSSVIVVALPQMAAAHSVKDVGRFARIWILVGIAVGSLAVAAVIMCWSAGRNLTALLLGTDFVNQPLLVALMIGYSVAVMQGWVALALQATRQFRALAAVDIIAMVAVGGMLVAFVPGRGEIGAAAALGAGMLISGAIGLLFVLRELKSMRNS